MEDFFISLLAGLFGCAVVAWAFHKAMKQLKKADNFVENVVKMPRVTKWWNESWMPFWIFIGTMFFAVIKIAQWIGTNLAGVQY